MSPDSTFSSQPITYHQPHRPQPWRTCTTRRRCRISSSHLTPMKITEQRWASLFRCARFVVSCGVQRINGWPLTLKRLLKENHVWRGDSIDHYLASCKNVSKHIVSFFQVWDKMTIFCQGCSIVGPFVSFYCDFEALTTINVLLRIISPHPP